MGYFEKSRKNPIFRAKWPKTVENPETLDFAIFGGLVLSDTGSDRTNLCAVEWKPRGRYLGQISAQTVVVGLIADRAKIVIFRVEGTGPSILAIFTKIHFLAKNFYFWLKYLK